MAYNITLSDGTTIVTIPDGAIYQTYSVPLVGQNTSAYGDDVAAAFLRGLENFAYLSPPDTNPNIPGSVKLTGQLWYDTGNAQLKVNSGGTWNTLLTSASGLTGITGDITPIADSLYDIGTTSLRWAEIWADDIAFGGTMTVEAAGDITVSGTLTSDGGSTVDLNGTVTIAGATFDGRLNLADPDTTTFASMRLAEATGLPSGGTATGDMWLETDGVHVIINSVEQVLGVVGPAGGVTSFEGRSGVVTTEAEDYSDGGSFNFYPRKDGAGGTQTILAGAAWSFSNSPAFTNATPFSVTNAALVANLNADLLDGQEGAYYAVDAQVVKLTTNQSILGEKTFNTSGTFGEPAVIVNVATTVPSSASADSGEAIKIIGDSDFGKDYGYIAWYDSNGTSEHSRIGRTHEGTATGAPVNLTYWINSGNHEFIASNQTDYNLQVNTGGIIVQSFGVLMAEISSPGGTQNTSIEVRDAAGAMRNVGFNETPEQVIAGVPVTLNGTHVGKWLTRTAVDVTDVRLDGSITQWPVGGSLNVHNDNATGLMRIVENSGTLEWIDGSGSLPLTGARTLAYNGVCTIRKKSASVYQIWGNGIS